MFFTSELVCFKLGLFLIYIVVSLPAWKAFIIQTANPKSASDHLKYHVAHLCFWFKVNGKAWQDCRVGDARFIFFFLWCMQEKKMLQREKERDRQTERKKKQNGFGERQRHCIKSIKRISYQGKIGSVNSLYAKNSKQQMYWVPIMGRNVNNWCVL